MEKNVRRLRFILLTLRFKIYFGTKVKIATECFGIAMFSLLTFPLKLSAGMLSLFNQRDNSEPTTGLVKFALISSSDGFKTTK